MYNPLASTPLDLGPVFSQDWKTAYFLAQKLGLNEAESEDCAIGFVLYMLDRDKGLRSSETLRRRCARDFVYDVRRALSRRSKHEAFSLSDGEWEQDKPDERPLPEQAVMRKVFWDLLEPFLSVLPQEACCMLLKQCVEGWTVQELAEEFGRTEGSVEQALLRSRRRLRGLLKHANLDVFDLLDDTHHGA